ncbi:MAG: hypothetical protein JW700_03555 [Candidatus Aenigmarchaeota archaeon]|nr:hypothetical protein [Candidatus Aenigmarchaeota archaeon]
MLDSSKSTRFSLDKIGFYLRQECLSQNDFDFKTKADMMLELVKKRKRTIPEICEILDLDENTVIKWIEAMEMRNLLKVKTSVLGDWFVVGC